MDTEFLIANSSESLSGDSDGGKKEIQTNVFFFTQYYPGPMYWIPESISGTFDYYGRGGTNCGFTL